MKTIKIKGKDYVPVVERVKAFHEQYKNGYIRTEMVSSDANIVIVKATIGLTDTAPFREFTGYSQAAWGVGMMGKVALEVAETSAVGRALGFANIGLLDSVASGDEVRKNSGAGELTADDDDFLG